MNFYNEFDRHAAEWLRNLIKEGLIAEGIVDERPIQEIKPDDLEGFTQAHFFAGIGGWSYALRLAGWSDDRPVWTGSCPCQSFSTAGKRKGASDERHLWPEWFRLISQCSPPVIFGEQVASAIGFGWLDAVATDLETNDYAFGSAVLSGFVAGAYHKRQRLWFVGHSEHDGSSPATIRGGFEASGNDNQKGSNIPSELEGTSRSNDDGSLDRVADSEDNRFQGGEVAERKGAEDLENESPSQIRSQPGGHCKNDGFVADTQIVECDDGFSRNFYATDEKNGVRGKIGTGSGVDKKFLADSKCKGLQRGFSGGSNQEREDFNRQSGFCSSVNWGAVEWIECQDGKTRPISLEPNVQPLVDGIPTVVDREGNPHKYSYTNALKGIGNAIIPQVAAEFITAFCDVEDTL